MSSVINLNLLIIWLLKNLQTYLRDVRGQRREGILTNEATQACHRKWGLYSTDAILKEIAVVVSTKWLQWFSYLTQYLFFFMGEINQKNNKKLNLKYFFELKKMNVSKT